MSNSMTLQVWYGGANDLAAALQEVIDGTSNLWLDIPIIVDTSQPQYSVASPDPATFVTDPSDRIWYVLAIPQLLDGKCQSPPFPDIDLPTVPMGDVSRRTTALYQNWQNAFGCSVDTIRFRLGDPDQTIFAEADGWDYEFCEDHWEFPDPQP